MRGILTDTLFRFFQLTYGTLEAGLQLVSLIFQVLVSGQELVFLCRVIGQVSGQLLEVLVDCEERKRAERSRTPQVLSQSEQRLPLSVLTFTLSLSEYSHRTPTAATVVSRRKHSSARQTVATFKGDQVSVSSLAAASVLAGLVSAGVPFTALHMTVMQ